MSEQRQTVFIGSADDYMQCVIKTTDREKFEALGFVDSIGKLVDSVVDIDTMKKAECLDYAKKVYDIDLDPSQKVSELREEIKSLAALKE